MQHLTYRLTDVSNWDSSLLSHFPSPQPVLHDGFEDEAMTEMLVEARAKSGDYLVTLATEIDKIAQALSMVGAPEAAELERLVTELLYVDKCFRLMRVA